MNLNQISYRLNVTSNPSRGSIIKDKDIFLRYVFCSLKIFAVIPLDHVIFGSDRSSRCHSVRLSVRLSVRDIVLILLISGSYLQADFRMTL